MRSDWLLNDDGVLDGGSDWFMGNLPKSRMEELTILRNTLHRLAVSQTATNLLNLSLSYQLGAI